MSISQYTTPWSFVKGLPDYPFDLDPCAERRNAKARRFYTLKSDGLMQHWFGKVFCNPPYSNPKVWIEKALFERERPEVEVIVMLLKSDTGTKWFHDLLLPNFKVNFLRDRIRFNGERAPWPCILARIL